MPSDTKDEFGIERNKIYRKTHPETRKILGLKPTAIDEAIADGTLPEPWPLTGHGKATGWLGEQLIEVSAIDWKRPSSGRSSGRSSGQSSGPRGRRHIRKSRSREGRRDDRHVVVCACCCCDAVGLRR